MPIVLYLLSALYLFAFFSLPEVGQVFALVAYNVLLFFTRLFIPFFNTKRKV